MKNIGNNLGEEILFIIAKCQYEQACKTYGKEYVDSLNRNYYKIIEDLIKVGTNRGY